MPLRATRPVRRVKIVQEAGVAADLFAALEQARQADVKAPAEKPAEPDAEHKGS